MNMANEETSRIMERTDNQKSRGGARPGCGRKPLGKKPVCIKLSPEAIAVLNAQKNKSEFTDRAILMAAGL
jgi:hypothetical protein